MMFAVSMENREERSGIEGPEGMGCMEISSEDMAVIMIDELL